MALDIEISESAGGYILRHEARAQKLKSAFAADVDIDKISKGTTDEIKLTLCDLFGIEEDESFPWNDSDMAVLQSRAQQLKTPTLDELE